MFQIWDPLNQKLITQYIHEENSILYSGLLMPIQDEILVFSGTVFSEVIIHFCYENTSLHYLKGHKVMSYKSLCFILYLV